MEIFSQWFHYLAEFFTILNPFTFFFCTCIWSILNIRTRRELDRAYMRSYALEKQIDFLVGATHPDREFFEYMKKTYKDLER